MRALLYYGPKDLRLENDVPEPVCQPGQVKVKPAFVGICGTDLHEYFSQTLTPLPNHPHPLTGETVPLILGHEFSGTVVEIGPPAVAQDGNPKKAVKAGLKVGDPVCVLPTLYCRACIPCKEGYTNCCVKNGFLGLSGWGGGLADFVCVDGDAVFKLPESIPLEIGALVEPLAVAWHAVLESGFQRGDDVLVMGAGPIGLATIQCLAAMGAGSITAAEVAEERQHFARKFGATHILDPRYVDVVAEAKALSSDGRGPAVAYDCAGVPASLDAATKAVRARGTIMNVAIWEKAVPFQPNNVVFHEKKYIGSLTYRLSDFDHVIAALDERRLKPEAMITRKIAVDRIVEEGFMALINEKDKHVKILIDLAA